MGKSAATAREVRFTLPSEIAAVLGELDEEQSASAREAVVVDLVRRRAISKGRGAEILGLHLLDFAQVLVRHRVPYFDYDEEDMADEEAGVEATLASEPE